MWRELLLLLLLLLLLPLLLCALRIRPLLVPPEPVRDDVGKAWQVWQHRLLHRPGVAGDPIYTVQYNRKQFRE